MLGRSRTLVTDDMDAAVFQNFFNSNAAVGRITPEKCCIYGCSGEFWCIFGANFSTLMHQTRLTVQSYA